MKGYRKIDLKTEFTFAQNNFAKQIFKKLFEGLEQVKDINLISLSNLDTNLEMDVIALMYIPIKEKYWTLEIHKKTVEFLETQPYTDYTEEIKDFFSLKGQSILRSFLTSLTALTPLGTDLQQMK